MGSVSNSSTVDAPCAMWQESSAMIAISSMSGQGFVSCSSLFVDVDRDVYRQVETFGVWHSEPSYGAYSLAMMDAPAVYAERPGRPKPDGPAIGESTVPVGNVLCPMLAYVIAYVAVRRLRVWNRQNRMKEFFFGKIR